MSTKIEYKFYLGLIPIMTTILIFSGIFWEMSYYNYFGLNLVYYLTFNESLTLFFNDILYITIAGLLSYLFLKAQFPKIPSFNLVDNINENRLYKYVIRFIVFLIIIQLLLLYDPIELIHMIFIFIFIFIIYVILGKLVIPYLQNEMDRKIGYIAMFFIIYLLFLWDSGLTKAQHVILDKNFQMVTILLRDSTIISTSDSIRFIGKTEKAYFYYNIKDTSTIVIVDAEVKRAYFQKDSHKFKLRN